VPLHPDIDLEHVSDQIVDRFTIYLFVTCFRRSEMTGSCTGTSLAFSTQIWIGLRNDLPPHSFGLPDSLSVELRGFGSRWAS